MMLRIETPEHAGSREQAIALTQHLPGRLDGETVALDCSKMLVGTPSFLDEIVKQVLELRAASVLEIFDAPARPRDLLERAAENRGVRDRLRVIAQAGGRS
jgi:hypothetical protein